MIEQTRQENARTDVKAAALLTVVGIGFTAFSAGVAAAAVAVPRGMALWSALAMLVLVTVAAEILLLVIRPSLRSGKGHDRYFLHWAGYRECPDRLAAEWGADVEDCRLLTQLSVLVAWKFGLVRRGVDVLLLAVPLAAATLVQVLLER